MYSFKEFFSLLFEMPMNVEDRMPIFDEFDRKYYKHIWDNAPPEVKNDDEAMMSLMRMALELRYGRKASESGGRGGKGKVLAMHQDGQNTFNQTFNVKGRRFEIKDIPMNPSKIIEKAKKYGFMVDDHFGYGFGPLNSREGKTKAKEYFEFFKSKKEPTNYGALYSPFRASKETASEEEKEKRRTTRELGVHKAKNKQIEDEFSMEKSMEEIPFDDEDKKFLEDVKNKFSNLLQSYQATAQESFSLWYEAKKREDPNQRSFDWDAEPEPDEPDDDFVRLLLRNALTIRYSDKFITQEAALPKDKKGAKFTVRHEYTDGEGAGNMYVNLSIPVPRPKNMKPQYMYFKGKINLENVYMNLPQLVQKFERYKKSQNFVKNQMDTQAAARFMTFNFYKPGHGLLHGETLRDEEFYNTIKRDHDLWRKRPDGTNQVKGAPVDDPEVAAKLKWRNGDYIIESPNIRDMKTSYDPDSLDWDRLIQKDAETATKWVINYLGNEKGMGAAFIEKATQKFEDGMMAAWTALATIKTGVAPEKYRSQRGRMNMAASVAQRAIESALKVQGTGEFGKGDDAPPSQVDITQSREKGLNVNTMKPSHRLDTEEPTGSTQVGYEDEDSFEPIRRGDDEPKWSDAAPKQMALSRPQSIPLRVWMQMTQDQKIAAIQSSGQPRG
jgi:hypothetical protein